MTQDVHSHDHSPTPKTSAVAATHVQNKRRKQPVLAWLEEPYNHTRGEMSLWVAVITQAMMDALSRANNAEAMYHKHEAVHWLTGNSKDFVMVCLCAGFDPDYVRRKAKRTLVAPISWRAEAGKGKRYLERKGYRQKSCEPRNKSCESQLALAKPFDSSCTIKNADGVARSDCAGSHVIILRSGNAARRI